MRIQKDIYEKHVETIAPGRVIFNEGEEGKEMYVIIEGSVEISKKTTSSSSKTLIHLKTGDIFGEMAIIEGKARSATAIATEKTRLLIMNENLFLTMIEKNPDFASKMIKILCERIRKSNALIQDLINTNKEKQIFSGIFEYAKKHGESSFKGYRVNISGFSEWASKHLGIPVKEIGSFITSAVEKKQLAMSASSQEYIVIPKTQP